MKQFNLHWINANGRSRRVLKVEAMNAADAESAKRKALALFDDGGAIHGANLIELHEEGAAGAFWSHQGG